MHSPYLNQMVDELNQRPTPFCESCHEPLNIQAVQGYKSMEQVGVCLNEDCERYQVSTII